MLKKPFQLGELTLPSNVFCAPLAGCSDYPFRKMLSLYRPGLFFCEMVHMNALIRHDEGTYRLLDYSRDMHPIGAQICGTDPKIAGQAAKIIEDLGFDVIDLNCGCPVDKVVKDGSGSGMLKKPHQIGDIIDNIVKAVTIPVTVKIRAGWDDDQIVAAKITEIAEAAGAKLITIHGRTREQGYSGLANRSYIKAAKEAAKAIKVFGNGDIFDAKSAEEMFTQTGCDGILVARGSFGQPWIFEDIYLHFQNKEPKKRNLASLRDHLLQHLGYIASYASERKALLDLRRVGNWYLKNIERGKQLRESLVRCQKVSEVEQLILSYAWE
jgi:tRNA-dihydrouridine synthase B